MSNILSFKESLREHQRKLTRSRQAVLDVITQADHHLTTAEVYRKAKAKHKRIGLTTVYRTLDLLVELDYIQRIHLSEGCHSYAATTQPHAHHLVCSACGRAEAFAECDLEPLMQAIQTKTGYTIDVHMLELMGRCPACQQKGASKR
jgi:Fur family ferric uptake transcriptional regulator